MPTCGDAKWLPRTLAAKRIWFNMNCIVQNNSIPTCVGQNNGCRYRGAASNNRELSCWQCDITCYMYRTTDTTTAENPGNSFAVGDMVVILYRIVAWAVALNLLPCLRYRTSLMSQHWFKKWSGDVRQQTITWADLCCRIASPGIHRDLEKTGGYVSDDIFQDIFWKENIVLI